MKNVHPVGALVRLPFVTNVGHEVILGGDLQEHAKKE